MKSSDASEFRHGLKQTVAKSLTDEPVALLFSAGTDSLTVLWTLLELGAKVTCYTFRLRSLESVDARASKLACAHWGVPQVLVTEGDAPVVEDVQRVITTIKSDRKTHVEVMYGYWHLLAAVKEQNVWSGIQADTLYGSNKSAAIKHRNSTAAQFAEYRRNLLSDPGQEGLAQAHMVAEHFGRTLHAPYSDQTIRDWFMRWSWRDLNTPKQKQSALMAFPERFKELAIYRHDDNFQCGSGIREHMAAAFGGHQRAEYSRILCQTQQSA